MGDDHKDVQELFVRMDRLEHKLENLANALTQLAGSFDRYVSETSRDIASFYTERFDPMQNRLASAWLMAASALIMSALALGVVLWASR